jgi:hypothetical protein
MGNHGLGWYGRSMALAGNHAITPVRGSARRVDGTPADLMNPRDYPVEALCLECGGPIRTEQFYSPGWDHIERFTLHGLSA